MATEITTPVGRLVMGHPMIGNPVIDDKTKQPKIGADGQPRLEFYVGLAIPKGQETDWKQTEWGQKIQAEAVAGWPAGEHMQPAFAWKIIDGDSPIPNKAGKAPNTREGFPGHWVMNCSNGFPLNCFRVGKYNPMTDQIKRKEEIKRGDYARLVVSVKGNAPSQSPGVYINPSLFELYQAGIEIVSENAPDAAATFGAVAGVLPANALIDTNAPVTSTHATQGPPVAPATDFLAPGNATPPPPPPPPPSEASYNVNGVTVTHSALLVAGWSEAQIAGLTRV